MLRRLSISAILAFVLISSSTHLMAKESAILNFIASPKGVAIITFTYAITTGISNVLWGMNWTWVGASDQANSIVQAVGGLSAAAEAFILGAFIPIICYKYLQHKKKAHPDTPAAQTVASDVEAPAASVPAQAQVAPQTQPVLWYFPSSPPPYVHVIPQVNYDGVTGGFFQ